MRNRSQMLATMMVIAFVGTPIYAESQQAKKAVERGLAFLVDDAKKWRSDRQCSTCHHGVMTVWALSEAQSRGYAVSDESLADFVKWTKERTKDIEKARDPRPGWNMVSTPALYLETMAQAVPSQGVVSAEERTRIVDHLLRHQESDGSWAWTMAPAQNRAPPHFESDEVATRLGYLALSSNATARDGKDRAAAWLARTKLNDTTQAAVLEIVVKMRSGESAKAVQPLVDAFFARQNSDGGWAQARELASDAYATGQALYYLRLANVSDRSEIQRGMSYLIASQKSDGSWPMTPRAHPGAKPASNPSPIIYLGSAWATLGLMRQSK